MTYTIPLRLDADIKDINYIVIHGALPLDPGLRMEVALANGQAGTLEIIRKVDANTWRMRWEREGSPLDGRAFDLVRTQSTFCALDQVPDWNCDIRLVPARS